MTPVEWPIVAQASDRPVATLPIRGAPNRAAVARRDFFLDPALRLTEEERALVGSLLNDLVEEIADQLKAALPPLMAARADWRRHDLTRRLEAAGLIDRDGLFRLLLRRADEQRLHGREGKTVQQLTSDGDGPVAAAAMGLLLARGRRRDRFGRLGIELDDLPPDEARALVIGIAAVIRDNFHDGNPDTMLTGVAHILLDRHDPQRRLDGAMIELVDALYHADLGHDDVLLVALATEGEAALLAALLARQAQVDPAIGWGLLTGEEAGGIGMLLRLAGIDRAAAAGIIVELAPRMGIDEIALIDGFDQLRESDIEARRSWWQLDPLYRSACLKLDEIDGQRGL